MAAPSGRAVIKVMTTGDALRTMPVDLDMTGEALKVKIEALSGQPGERLRLVVSGEAIEDSSTLRESGVRDGSVVYAVLRPPPPTPEELAAQAQAHHAQAHHAHSHAPQHANVRARFHAVFPIHEETPQVPIVPPMMPGAIYMPPQPAPQPLGISVVLHATPSELDGLATRLESLRVRTGVQMHNGAAPTPDTVAPPSDIMRAMWERLNTAQTPAAAAEAAAPGRTGDAVGAVPSRPAGTTHNLNRVFDTAVAAYGGSGVNVDAPLEQLTGTPDDALGVIAAILTPNDVLSVVQHGNWRVFDVLVPSILSGIGGVAGLEGVKQSAMRWVEETTSEVVVEGTPAANTVAVPVRATALRELLPVFSRGLDEVVACVALSVERGAAGGPQALSPSLKDCWKRFLQRLKGTSLGVSATSVVVGHLCKRLFLSSSASPCQTVAEEVRQLMTLLFQRTLESS
eukprot:Rhum_TRINITY_DN8634_c0_g1::Rhum_TRINITY_DN8634_c0_g1_i1::g.29129::m.29129